MSAADLTTQQQALAEELADGLRPDAADFLRRLTELLAAADAAAVFGDTQIALRDLALRFAARACERRLREKKTATPVPASPARTAGKSPPTTETASGPS